MKYVHVALYIYEHISMFTQLSVPQIEYTLGGSSKRDSHVYFQLIVAMVLLL